MRSSAFASRKGLGSVQVKGANGVEPPDLAGLLRGLSFLALLGAFIGATLVEASFALAFAALAATAGGHLGVQLLAFVLAVARDSAMIAETAEGRGIAAACAATAAAPSCAAALAAAAAAPSCGVALTALAALAAFASLAALAERANGVGQRCGAGPIASQL